MRVWLAGGADHGDGSHGAAGGRHHDAGVAGDGFFGMAAFRKDFDMKLLRWGLVGIGLGTLLFKVLSVQVVAGMVGAFTLLFLARRLSQRLFYAFLYTGMLLTSLKLLWDAF